MQLLVFLFIALLTPATQAQESVQSQFARTSVKRINKEESSLFEIQADCFVRATPQQAWRVLSDYERFPEFVPDIVSSKLVSRTQHEAIVEQHSKPSFLFVSQSIHMVVRIEEQPFSAINVTLLSGDMKHYTAHWKLEPFAQNGIDGTHITFSGTMEPAFFVPPLVGTSIVQANIRKVIEAVVTEIERRVGH